MPDTVTEVTHTSWFSRLMSSVFGVLIGGAVYVGMFVLLFWNEGRAVRTHQDLEEGKHAVVEAPSERIDPSFEGKLVHMVGRATTDETLRDDVGVHAVAIKLRREVEMFQWVENRSTHTKKTVGGGETTETTYSYSKYWKDSPISSSSFHSPGGHTNPGSFPIQGNSYQANAVTFGAFRLSDALVREMNNFERLTIDPQVSPPAGFRLVNNEFYRGANPDSPQIGDVRVRYEIVPPETVSVIARQVGDSFQPFQLSTGREQLMLSVGEQSAEAMYAAAEQFNVLLTWGLRLGGFLGMWFGLFMSGQPLAVVLDVLPLLGNIARWGIGAMTFVVAVVSATVGIAVAWFVYRPLLAVLAVAGAVALIFVVRMFFAGRKREAEVNQLFSPPPPPPPPPTPA